MTRQNKGCLPAFVKFINKEDVSDFVSRMLEMLKGKPSVKECNTIATFILTFYTMTSDDLLKKLYEALKSTKNGAKAAATIEKDTVLMAKLSEDSAEMIEFERMIQACLKADNISIKQVEVKFKENYALTMNMLPEIKDTDGNVIPAYAFAYLMIAHEEYKSDAGVIVKYKNPGIRPDIAPIVEKIDAESFQAALRKIADDNLGISGYTKKMYLAYPICRYANDELTGHLTSIAPAWKSRGSGNNTPSLRTFRNAILYNNSRATIFFVEKYKELDHYAKIRNTNADIIRDKQMSDVGLAPDSTKTYDLGNQTVTIKMLPDLTFAMTTSGGKVVKSIPKKDADPEKYDAAKADFSEIKKFAKRIVTARKNILFEDFLNNKKRPAKDWSEAYFNNPLLRHIGSLLIWCQDKNTFTISNSGPIDISGNAYEIKSLEPICVAHPMEMTAADVKAWQKYFNDNKLKQPFLQVWEPVATAENITPDRYDGIEIPFDFLRGAEKHGISVEYEELYNYTLRTTIDMTDCEAEYEFIGWPNHLPEGVMLSNFRIREFNRKSNHIVSLLDKWTVSGRIAKDDVSVAEIITNATLAQLTYYIDIAGQNNATNCMALLLELKNKNYPDFDPMDEFTLD